MAGIGGIYVFWALYFLAAVVCQILTGDFPSAFFAFPVNAAFMLLWMAVLWVLFREKRGSWTVDRLLLSRHTTYIVATAAFAAFLIQGFSSRTCTGTWWFVAAIFALLTNLFLVLLRGMSFHRPYRLRFFLNHAGLFLAISGGFFGSPDNAEWMTVANIHVPVRNAADKDGHAAALDHDFLLSGFYMDSYSDGTARNYEADVVVDGRETVRLKVNHPHSLSWQDDLYLYGFTPDNAGKTGTDSCILQVVRHPWKYVELAGILMLLGGAFMLFVQGPAVKSSGNADNSREGGVS